MGDSTASAKPIDPGRHAAELIRDQLIAAQCKLVVHVAESRMTGLYHAVHEDARFQKIYVAREEEGVGICAGTFLGGTRSVLMMANAGLQAAVHAIANLSIMCRLPVVMLIGNRGRFGDPIFYQEYTGQFTQPLLDSMQIPTMTIDTLDKVNLIPLAFDHAWVFKKPVAILLERETLDPIKKHYLLETKE